MTTSMRDSGSTGPKSLDPKSPTSDAEPPATAEPVEPENGPVDPGPGGAFNPGAGDSGGPGGPGGPFDPGGPGRPGGPFNPGGPDGGYDGRYGYGPGRPAALRRSGTDRMVSGVSGGLGEYFGVDAVIFRVLFAVLTFFAGVGLLLYLVCWLLIPEPDAATSALDRAVAQLRLRRVPPWVAIVTATFLLWIGWFSWWAPREAMPAVALIAVVLIVLVRRLGTGVRPVRGTHAPYPWEGQANSTYGEPAGGPGGADYLGSQAGPLVPPLNDLRRSVRDWHTESQVARRERVRRRRPLRVAVGLALVAGWAVVAVLDAANRVSFPAYLWVGLAVLGLGFVISLLTRRVMPSLLAPIMLLTATALLVGGTPVSLTDGSGKLGLAPTSAAQLTDQRHFVGDTTLDLTELPTPIGERTITISQAIGRVRVVVPRGLNAVVDARVHVGDIQRGTSESVGDYVGGFNTGLVLDPRAPVTGSVLTIKVDLTVGHVQVDVSG